MTCPRLRNSRMCRGSRKPVRPIQLVVMKKCARQPYCSSSSATYLYAPSSTVVECQEHRNFMLPAAKAVDRAHRGLLALLPDGQDMIVKVLAVELVQRFVVSQMAIRPIRHIVVRKRHCFHQEIVSARLSCRTEE